MNERKRIKPSLIRSINDPSTEGKKSYMEPRNYDSEMSPQVIQRILDDIKKQDERCRARLIFNHGYTRGFFTALAISTAFLICFALARK